MNPNAMILNANHPSLGVLSPALAPVGHVAGLLTTWRRRAVDRAQLRSLDAHMLRDVGLSLADVECEAGKPFWRG
jgi:uncharacterized protein YjiS (DUF1127 family)